LNSRFEIRSTPIEGLKLIHRAVRGDDRGCLQRMFCASELGPLLGKRSLTQINHTVTMSRGTVRGMHCQNPPFAEAKFVSCLHGAVFDVAVDLRRGSPTFLRWHAEVLSADNHATMYIPEGFAHGFQTCAERCEMLYLHTADYVPDAERGFDALDPRLAIHWPEPVSARSVRDAGHALIGADFAGIEMGEGGAF
jgi:dTDP-4-dehydrorhamnose 3,5-epimerase